MTKTTGFPKPLLFVIGAVALLAIFELRYVLSSSASPYPSPSATPEVAVSTTAATAARSGPSFTTRPAEVPAASVAEAPALKSTGDRSRDTQIVRVVQSMAESKKPPQGVAQGGNPPGNFRNREGKLPRGGSYIESDIWPSAGRSRGTERLIFGANGEVWFTGDHYETFTRLK
jgi:ribonuclease T1